MTIERKVGMGIAGQPSGGATNVADVFSTFLYTGTGSNQTINNGIDLSGEGGLTWIKGRDAAYGHNLYDTERGVTNSIASSSTSATAVKSDGLTSFNNNGFTLGSSGSHNTSTKTYVSWTFRKKEKFFDIVTYTGNGVAGRQIAHSLGSVPAMIITKSYNSGANWDTYHSSLGNTKYLHLNETTASATGSTRWNSTTPTDSVFTLGVTTNSENNTYIAYLFADNSSEDAEDQMIKSGSFTDSNGGSVNLGWEPQWVMIKRTDSPSSNGARTSKGNWIIADTMRGMPSVSASLAGLAANVNTAELLDDMQVTPTATGFDHDTLSYQGNANFIYVAIRAPLMVEPEAATEVFAIDTRGSTGDGKEPGFRAPFPVDMQFQRYTASGNTYGGTRLTQGKAVATNLTNAEISLSEYQYDYMNGMHTNDGTQSTFYSWMWKRAKGFMDVVAWKGNATARTIPHSLGVVPEMIWVKNRDATENWFVYVASEGINKWLYLSAAGGSQSGIATLAWNNTAPSATVLSLGTHNFTNDNNRNLIAYLFATLDGISKVGSYTGNGATSQNIDCGFSNGARFVLIKCASHSGSWHFMDTVRGIVAGSESHLALDVTTASESDDFVDPYSAGFAAVLTAGENNASGRTYIFYAIA